MPGLFSPRAGAPSLLDQVKVAISGTHTPKHIYSYSIEAVQHDSTQPSPALTINDLPPEILSEIFHTYLFWEDESDLIDPELEGLISVIEPSSRSAPLLFCQVCSYWREIAISTPALWSSIALKDTLQLDTVNIWLQRSRNYPLSFAVWLSSPRDQPAESVDKWVRWPELLELLCREIHRWQDVLVHVPSITNTQVFMDALMPCKGISPASMLRTLEVSNEVNGEQMDQDTIARLASFPHPHLRRLTWASKDLPIFQHLDGAMWTRLKQLTFVKVEAHILLAFLEACPNVSFLNIGALLTYLDEELPNQPITAPNLRTMHIDEAAGDLTEAFLYLIAPRLERLSFLQNDGRPGTTDRLLAFLSQSQCNLSSLSVMNLDYTFSEHEARRMLVAEAILNIPNVSFRMDKGLCQPSFPQELVQEVNKIYNHVRPTFGYLEPTNHCYHMGWGSVGFYRSYSRYPFLRKGPIPRPKWHTFVNNGPLSYV